MNYAAIGPLSLASYFQHHPYHMALAQYLGNRDYLHFYKDRVKEGKFVILDSGVYENAAVSDKELLRLCMELQPTAVIAPDVPHDAEGTDRKSYRFSEKIHTQFAGMSCPRVWKVLHAEPGNFEEFVTSYLEGAAAFPGVCFSRLTKDYGVGGVLFPRPTFIRQLQERGLWDKSIHHHCLGMADGSLEEWSLLNAYGINSCDSSAPIWRGIHGEVLPVLPEEFPIAFDPFWEPGEAHIKDAILLDNLQAVSLCVS